MADERGASDAPEEGSVGPRSSEGTGESPGDGPDPISASSHADGSPPGDGTEVEAVLTVEEELERERDELRVTLQRVQADFENFRKRVMRDQAAQLDRAADALVEQLLPVLDSFELAVLAVPEGDLDDAAAKLRKGVDLVYAELLGVLEKAGLERIDAYGKPFDPEEHEAVLRDGDGDTVTEVMRTGYRLKGRVLRAAMVKVGSGAPPGAPAGD